MKLEKDAWYWISDPNEGDIFYPIQAVDETYVRMDEKHYHKKDIEGLTINKAILPNDYSVIF